MDVAKTKEAFRRRARAGIPFNPVTGAEFAGGNLMRLKRVMQSNGWKDARFVTQAEAQSAGWRIDSNGFHDAEAVVSENGQLRTVELFGAANVQGMPSLDEMLALDAEQFARMMGQAPKPVSQQQAAPKLALETPQAAVEPESSGIGEDAEVTVGTAAVAQQQVPAAVAEPAAQAAAAQADTDLEEEDVTIGPAPHQHEKASPDATAERAAEPSAERAAEQPRQAQAQGHEAEKPSGDLAVMALYFLDGLHNFDGIEIAKHVNRLIAAQQLQKDRKAIEVLLSSFPNARRLGIEIVTAERLRDDRLLKDNPSEPATLLDGALARDKEGAYRPAAGGLAVLQDKGTSLVLKNRSENAYRGAMELAKSKGWAAIELKGKPKMLAQAWIEAKLMGLEVVNYKPTDKDRERLAERMGKEAERQVTAGGKGAVAHAETVEVHPVVDAAGRQKAATVTQRVDEPAQAQAAAGPGAEPGPAVARTVTRFEGAVREDVSANSVAPASASGPGAAQPAVSPATAATAPQVAQAVNESNEASKATAAAGTLDAAVLLKHGPAPYANLPSNRMSYFANLRDSAGVERTVWGVDLARSFSEAGADLGDTISLQEQGRQPVTVEGPLAEGGIGPKTAHRVRWETSVLTKGPQVASAVDAVVTGTHIGPIMKIEGGLVGQKAGRDPEKLSWHDSAKLTGGVPALGDWAEIAYNNGMGAVKVRGQELAQGIGR